MEPVNKLVIFSTTKSYLCTGLHLCSSGVLVKQIYDHQIIFTRHIKKNYLEKINKFVTVETKDKLSMQNFVDELKQLKADQLDS